MPSHTTTSGAEPTPRTKPAPQRRRELLDGGLEVFRDKGVTATTVDQITRAAGVAKGTFYLHFESKEHLLAALQLEFETALVDRLDDAAAAAGDDPDATLLAWVDAAFAFYPADVALHDGLFHHSVLPADAPVPAASDEHEYRDLVASVADVIEHGRAAGTFEVEDVESTALLLCSALHRMFDRVWHRESLHDVPRLHRATHTLFRRALGEQP